MVRSIVRFDQDAAGGWVVELSCGHRRHARQDPALQLVPGVLDDEARARRVGAPIECDLCDEAELVGPSGGEGGDPACWAGLLCPGCGVLPGQEPHRPGCDAGGGRATAGA